MACITEGRAFFQVAYKGILHCILRLRDVSQNGQGRAEQGVFISRHKLFQPVGVIHCPAPFHLLHAPEGRMVAAKRKIFPVNSIMFRPPAQPSACFIVLRSIFSVFRRKLSLTTRMGGSAMAGRTGRTRWAAAAVLAVLGLCALLRGSTPRAGTGDRRPGLRESKAHRPDL